MDKNKKTKIIATIGPASDNPQIIKKMIQSGVNIFRFNTKHADTEWHNERIKIVKNISEKMKTHVGIMIDLQGNEARIKTRDEKNILIKKNEIVKIGSVFNSDDIKIIIPDEKIINKIKIGISLLIDDGLIELKVLEKDKKLIKTKVIEGGIIKNQKSINFPGSNIKLASLIQRDIENLNLVVKNNVTFIALSFVSSKHDILILKEEMKKRNIFASIISKIENTEALQNLNEIIDESDGLMIARGDLGIEIPIEQLAYWQKEIINRCRKKRKPVIVATQMLQSMVENSRPSRAEVTDVANAVFDGTDAVMLSEETAIGKYPLKSVSEMFKILKFNEDKSLFQENDRNNFNPTEFVVGAIAKEVEFSKLKIKTAIVFTESGYTARVLSSFRRKIKIIAITNNQTTVNQLTISYGITSYYFPFDFSNLKLPDIIIKNLKSKKVLFKNETVAVFHGKYSKKPNLINLFSLTQIE